MFDWKALLRQHRVLAISTVVAYGLGLGTAYKLYRPKPVTAAEGKAPGERQKNGSLLLPRDPSAKVPSLPKVVPEGAKVARTIRLEYLPTVGTTGSSLPAEIDLNVLTMPDGTTRILAESTTGEIKGGIDIPRTPVAPELKWSAGALYSPVQKTYGVFLDRDMGPLRVGVVVAQTQVQGLRSVDIWAKVGLRF